VKGESIDTIDPHRSGVKLLSEIDEFDPKSGRCMALGRHANR